MEFYFAPLVGVTGYVYRNVHRELYPGIEKYFAPFISPNEQGVCKSKEMRDILPKNNEGTKMIPQILTNNVEYFRETANQLLHFGYEEINLNLGCPSAPLVKRGRGSGFLARREELKYFLEEITKIQGMRLSIKTRLGKDNPEEIYELMKIFNGVPLEELIIHARVQQDFYKNTPNMEVFKEAVAMSRHPICYNGDIFTIEDYHAFVRDCPNVTKVMLGRGLLNTPDMVTKLAYGEETEVPGIRAFHDRIYEVYKQEITGESHILNRMKQFWFYLNHNAIVNNPSWNLVKECDSIEAYDAIVEQVIAAREE